MPATCRLLLKRTRDQFVALHKPLLNSDTSLDFLRSNMDFPLPLDRIFIIGIWIETMLYGTYFYLEESIPH